ncbi:MAG: transposase [Bacteroidia bacterium]
MDSGRGHHVPIRIPHEYNSILLFQDNSIILHPIIQPLFNSVTHSAYNPEIHHRRSIRLQGYDYAQSGLYYVTICAQGQRCIFGTVFDSQMHLNELGIAANQCWLEIPLHYPMVLLHEHIVMPNHVHGIIEIAEASVTNMDEPTDFTDATSTKVGLGVGVQNSVPLPPTLISTLHSSLEPCTNKSDEEIARLQNLEWGLKEGTQSHQFQKIIPRSIGSIIRGYKLGVTKWVRANTEIQKPWQRNFHESIIRSYEDYLRITQYIKDNPMNWKGDEFYK